MEIINLMSHPANLEVGVLEASVCRKILAMVKHHQLVLDHMDNRVGLDLPHHMGVRHFQLREEAGVAWPIFKEALELLEER